MTLGGACVPDSYILYLSVQCDMNQRFGATHFDLGVLCSVNRQQFVLRDLKLWPGSIVKADEPGFRARCKLALASPKALFVGEAEGADWNFAEIPSSRMMEIGRA